jgi:hypothetical protein
MSSEKPRQLNLHEETKILEAKAVAEEARNDVKQLRSEFYEMKRETHGKIENVQRVAENIRDNHLAHIAKDMNDFKLQVTEALGDLKVVLERQGGTSKLNKTLIWFVFAELFILVFGAISAIVIKAITSALYGG